MNPVLAEILRTQTVRDANGGTHPPRSHIPPGEGEIIQDWGVARRPRSVLEIGLAYGISTLFICDALARCGWPASYHIIDSCQRTEWRCIGRLNIDQAGYGERYLLHEEPSELCLPRLLAGHTRIDFALIDSWHTFDHALVELFYVNRMLEPGGAVVFDDAHLPSIQKLCRYIETYACYRPLPIPDRFARLTRARARALLDLPPYRIVAFEKTAPDRRSWHWHRDF